MGAAHFRVATLALAAPPHDTALVSVGEVLERTGVVETLAGAPGSKMEGSTWTGFTDTTGSTWQVWDSPADLPADVRIEVRGRAVELSPYAAHMPGPMLWIGAFTRIE